MSTNQAADPLYRYTQQSATSGLREMQTYDDNFETLYRIAFRVAYRILGQKVEAEDVAQETMAKAYSHWWRIKPEAARWVSRVAANNAIDVWRKRSKQDLTGEDLVRAHDGEPIIERLALVEALSRLSKRQREVVVLRYLAGYPEADVAEILDCSVGTVKTHASRGLHSLRDTMSADS
jgi:RNA polymerase sigma-70 factor (sigma-E family)